MIVYFFTVWIFLQVHASEAITLGFNSTTIISLVSIGVTILLTVVALRIQVSVGTLKNNVFEKLAHLEISIEKRFITEREYSERKFAEEVGKINSTIESLQKDIKNYMVTKEDLKNLKENIELRFKLLSSNQHEIQ